jgi:hypothetical protein
MLFLFLAFLDGPRLAPEDRALAYLVREVPAWNAKHQCFSCHNNGDGARTLYVAIRLGRAVPEKSLADTARWLAKPDDWDNTGDDRTYGDKQLDRVQFATALLAAADAGRMKDRKPLLRAAELIASNQHRDGFWPVGADGSVGSPATHGATLATIHARRVLERADPEKYKEAIRKADVWLSRKPIKAVLDAAAILLTLELADDGAVAARREECLAVLRKGEAKEGGWGPYVNSSPEVFDTALVVLALSRQPETKEIRDWLRRGRAYLAAAQQADGSWPETTRPSGAESYAQRISTTAWATHALLATHQMTACPGGIR